MIKMYYATVYVYKFLNIGSKNEEFLFDEQGDKKWKARVLTN